MYWEGGAAGVDVEKDLVQQKTRSHQEEVKCEIE
jgi:hypothetical protein